MFEDFGYQRDEEQGRVALIIKRAFVAGAILFSISCFIYITISAYYFVYNDENNEVAIIKSPEFPIKVIEEENKGGMMIKDLDKTVYESVVGGGEKEFIRQDNTKVIKMPEEPAEPENPAPVQIVSTEIAKSNLTQNNKIPAANTKTVNHNKAITSKAPSTSKLIVYDANSEFKTIHQIAKENVGSNGAPVANKVSNEIIKNNSQERERKNASRVQLAATNSVSSANEYWRRISNQYPRLFGGLKPFVQEIKLGQKGTFYRLQIGDFRSQVEAEEFCTKFIADTRKTRADCIVVE